MATIQVDTTAGALVGRLASPSADTSRVFVTFNAVYSTDNTYVVDFKQINVSPQQMGFGIPRAVFIDNGSNTNEIEVAVQGTDQFFTAPANSQGYFKLDAKDNAVISFRSQGVASDKVTITIYNHDVYPNVWYRDGRFSGAVTIADGADVAKGNTGDAAWTGTGPSTVISALKALVLKLLATGANALSIQGAVAAGSTAVGNPLKTGGYASSSKPASVTNGQMADTWLDPNGGTVISSYDGTTTNVVKGDGNAISVQPAISSTFWSYSGPNGGAIVNTTAPTTLKAAGGSGIRNYVQGLQLDYGTIGAAVDIIVSDGTNILYRGFLFATGGGQRVVSFAVPLKGAANAAITVQTSAAVTGGIYINAQGWSGA